MPCPMRNKSSVHNQFQQEYANSGKTLILKSSPTILFEQSDTYELGDLCGYMFRKPRLTTEVSLITLDGEEVTLSGDVATILNLLEKLK